MHPQTQSYSLWMHPPTQIIESVDASTDSSLESVDASTDSKLQSVDASTDPKTRVRGCIHQLYYLGRWMHPQTQKWAPHAGCPLTELYSPVSYGYRSQTRFGNLGVGKVTQHWI